VKNLPPFAAGSAQPAILKLKSCLWLSQVVSLITANKDRCVSSLGRRDVWGGTGEEDGRR
jgi:hypothetical protein